ncbi:MAG: regulatory protein RecX [Rhodoglobus sp.]
MTNSGTERIAPVTYIFGADAQKPDSAPVLDAEPETVYRGLQQRDSLESVSDVSARALARRGMSSREMSEYLEGCQFDPETVRREIGRLEAIALLDDVTLAEALTRSLYARKNWGRSAVVAELRRRGIDPLAIESALDLFDDHDELGRATALAAKRAPQLRTLDPITARRRLGDFLRRRGYSNYVVSQVVEQTFLSAGPIFR